MKNVYDTFIEKELLFILAEEGGSKPVSRKVLRKTAVFIYLYYDDSWERYSEYIKNIPCETDLYICSSNARLLDKIRSSYREKKNMVLTNKENRGRDISALLVIFGEAMLRYEYVCFIHDKKAAFHYMEEDTEFWIKNIWGNTLGSTDYIYRIIDLLQRDKIGLLVPPEPLGTHFNDWYTNGWKANYENTVRLASKLGIHADLSVDRTPMAIGTVFWGKTDAVGKLLQSKWDYNDFQDEPIPLDGAINHAVERILPFVAQDAGYDTGVIMCQKYAALMLLRLKEYMSNTYDFLRSRICVNFEHQLHTYDKLKSTIQRYFQEYEKVYIYGAGAWGIEFLKNLRFWGYCPDGFLVSDGHRDNGTVDGIKVYELGEVAVDGKSAVFIAVNYDIQNEIETVLLEKGFDEYYKLSLF